MRYFTYIAEQSFKSDDEWRRLFFIGGPFSRPYLIPDAATEARLFEKMTRVVRIGFYEVIGTSAIAVILIQQPWMLLVYLATAMALDLIALRIVFHSDLGALHRVPTRLPLRTFYTDTAQRHSEDFVFFMFLVSVVFVILGLVTSSAGGWMLALGVFVVVFFGVCSAVSVYVLHLKRGTRPRRLK